jgi:Zn-dependent membrane protease YugP
MGIGYIILTVLIVIMSMAVSARLRSKFRHYSEVYLENGMSGEEVARKMLADHGIYDVKVVHVEGELTDHYNPMNKTVNLSDAVFHQRNAAAAAVAAHECGHAVQHATAYNMLQLRSKLVPLQNASGRILNIVMIASLFLGGALYSAFPAQAILGIILACYGAIMLFSLVTLPVEFDASKRALAWMSDRGIVNSRELEGAKDSLKWAALTYVVAAFGSLLTFLYFLMQFLNAGRD